MISPNSIDSRIAIHRSYVRDVKDPLFTLDDIRLTTLARLEYGGHGYPLICAESTKDGPGDKPSVLISAGVHGDEPAGVLAIIEFLRDDLREFADRFHVVALPCVNPSGYEANTLETMNGVNLNRSFAINSPAPEIRAIESWLERTQRRYRVTLDLHEAPPYYRGEGFEPKDNPTGTYIYETVTNHSERIGLAMVESLPQDVEVCLWPTIYQDRNTGGVIAYPEACHNAIYAEKTSLDAYLNGRYTGHSFTTETPTFWTLEKRIQTQRAYLRAALRLITGGTAES